LRTNLREYFMVSSSLGIIFILVLGTVSSAFLNISSPVKVANAQEENEGGANQQSTGQVQVSFEYTYFEEYGSTTRSEKYVGSAILTPVEGGYDGNGTGTYEATDLYPPQEPCSEPQRTTYAGAAGLVVHAQYSIDNSVTGGPDTSQYNSSTTVIELIFRGDNISAESTGMGGGEKCESQSWTTSVGSDCHFYGIDFSVGGSYEKVDEDSQFAKCKLTIGPIVEDLRIFGTATAVFGGLGQKGISNSKVVVSKMDDEFMKPLSVSKPPFFSETLTSDDDTAQYEFRFARDDMGKLPRILVVSLLWFGGNPEFAVTNGQEKAGRFIPVYQALCVDDDVLSDCEKWQRSSTGYEAEVNFEYGNEAKLLQTTTIMEMEEWQGGNATLQVMKDSAYIYYNSYLAAKYFDTLGLPTLQPVMIKAHHQEVNCTGAYYDAPAKLNSEFPYFGDLGAFLDKVQATGSGAYICDKESALESPNAPVNREWHELGHYLMFQIYSDPYTNPFGTPHKGYLNANTNDSIIEGFAEFVAMLIYEHYGEPQPYIYPVGTGRYNLEQDYRVWGPWIHEEFAVAGILWDFHDGGIETNNGYVLNGTLIPVTKLPYPVKDELALDGKTILGMLDKSEPKTLAELHPLFYGDYGDKAVSILINHAAFADTDKRDWRYDGNREVPGETGTLVNPVRPVRHTPAPELPGSNLVSDRDSTFSVTIKHVEPFSYYDYSYLIDMRSGEPTYFAVPPEYYPSTVTVTPLSADGKPLAGAVEFDSEEYWDYIHSNPPENGVFRHISVTAIRDNGNATSLQYIQNVKNLLSRVSAEYKAGNSTGAEELAKIAYIDNYEYVEPELVQRNATELKEQTEEMLRVELVGLISDRADSEQIDAKIAEINSKLDEAITVVPEFPAGTPTAVLVAVVTATILYGRYRKRAGLHFP
jgi:hypothetical protein